MILVDTGAWLGLWDRRDAYHDRCVAFFRSNRESLMTTYPVLVECVHLMYRRVGVDKTLAHGYVIYACETEMRLQAQSGKCCQSPRQASHVLP